MTDVTTYHVDSGRTGVHPSFPFTTPGTWRQYCKLNLGSPAMGSDQPGVAVRGAPLYVEGWTFTAGPHAGETHDLIVIATSDNLVYAYAEDQLLADPTAGPLWGGNPTAGQPGYLGTPSSSLGSNIPIPIGVCSTPLVDRASARVFAMALISGAPDTYSIFSLDLNTGAILAQAQLNDTSTTAPHPFTSSAQG